MSTAKIRNWACVATLSALFSIVSLHALQTPAESPETLGAGALFDDGEIHDIWLHINSRDWEQLRAGYRENTYYPTDVEWRGFRVRNAGVRVRGRTSRSDFKPGLQLDFNRYVAGQEFLGLKSLVLDNLWQDPTMLRERLAMLVFRRMGLPAPRESHARVYVGSDRVYAGVYGVVEVVDKAFLERHFVENDGYLYEYHWQNPFGFASPGSDLDWYAARFEPRTRERESTWALYSPIQELVRAVNDAPADQLEEALAPYLDLETYITHIAVENFLSQPDGLVGNLGMNNFYLYRFAGKKLSQMIVWDQDLAFEGLDTFGLWENFDQNVLASKIRTVPRLRSRYLDTVVAIAESVGPPAGTPEVEHASSRQCPAPDGEPVCGWLETEVFREYAQIRESALADPRNPYSHEEFEQGVEFLKHFARQRSNLVRRDVARIAPEIVASSKADVNDRFRFRNPRARSPR
jgi:hypothetical protein